MEPMPPDDPIRRRRVLCALWTWRDLDARELKDVPDTDLIGHRVKLRAAVVPYVSRTNRRLSGYREAWLGKYIKEGMRSCMYERTPASEPLSP